MTDQLLQQILLELQQIRVLLSPPQSNPEIKNGNVTLDELRTLFQQASRAGHRDALKATLELHNAEILPDLAPSAYSEVGTYVRGLLNAG